MSALTTSDRTGCSVLPVAIMAHNEEKTIEKAVTSVLTQEVPEGFHVKVLVVANGCNDHTEEVVNSLAERYPDIVQLISIAEKGKTKAINRAIAHFEELSRATTEIPVVIFLDADCQFLHRHTLRAFTRRFRQVPELWAVGADCLPDVLFNSRNDIVSGMYRATYDLSKRVRVNSISGMCYAIRLDILKMIAFPEVQFAEDMFVSARVDGRFLRDGDIQIVYGTPVDLRSEIRRRIRQEISTQRYHQYYAFLRKREGRVKLPNGGLGDEFRWRGPTDNNMLTEWLRVPGVMKKLYLICNLWMRLYAKIAARRKLRALRNAQAADYWVVDR